MVMVMRLVITPVGQVASMAVASAIKGPFGATGMLQLWWWKRE